MEQDGRMSELINRDEAPNAMPPVETTDNWSEWISVEDAMPNRDMRILVYIPEMNGSDCNIQISKGWGVSKYVTHWMTLPEPPKGE